MSGIASWQAEIKLDINDLKKRLSEAEKELGEVTEKEHKVKLDIDTKTLDSAIKKLDKMLDSLGKGTGDFKQFENLCTQLESITSDVKSLSNAFSKIDDSKLQGLFSSVQNIDNTLDKLSTHILSVGQNMKNIGSDNGIKDAVKNTQNLTKANEEAAKSAEKLASAQKNIINKQKTSTDKKIAKPEEQARSKASKYIESAQKKLKDAISKYSYGDTSEASTELEKLGKAWANFATKDNPNPTLEQVEARMKEIDNTIASIISKLKTDHTSNLKKLNDEIKDEDKSKKKKESEKKKKTSDKNSAKWSTFNNDLNKTKKSEERRLQGKSFDNQVKSIERLKEELEGFHTQGIISEKQFTDATNKINGIKQHLEEMKADINKNFTDSLDKSVEKYQKELDERRKKPEHQNQGKPYKDALNEYSFKLKELEAIQTKIRDNNGLATEGDKTRVKELTKEIEKYSDALKNMSAANKGSTEISRQKELQKIGDYLQRNTKISEEAKAKLKEYMAELKSGNASTNIEHIHTEFLKIAQAEREAGREGKSFFSVIKEKVFYGAAGSIASYFGINDLIQYGRQGIETVRELNTALTEMRKVSTESLGTLKEYQSTTFDTANDVGTTAKQIQDSTADYMRLGESLQDAAESAKTANVLLNVSEFDNIEDATKSLVAMGQAYKDLDKMSIVDRLNEIGNNYSISTDELASGLQKSAATLSLMGNTIDEAAALITTANSVIQDSDSVSAGLRTISLRLVGTEESEKELSAMNEEVDAFVKSTNSKKQQIIKDYTAVASNNYQGFNILDENGNYKNTYNILLGISKIYKEIQEQDKKLGTNHAVALVEELAGELLPGGCESISYRTYLTARAASMRKTHHMIYAPHSRGDLIATMTKCVICGKIFQYRGYKKKCCSEECLHDYKVKLTTKQHGLTYDSTIKKVEQYLIENYQNDGSVKTLEECCKNVHISVKTFYKYSKKYHTSYNDLLSKNNIPKLHSKFQTTVTKFVRQYYGVQHQIVEEYSFQDCINPRTNYPLRFDIFVVDMGIVI